MFYVDTAAEFNRPPEERGRMAPIMKSVEEMTNEELAAAGWPIQVER